MANWPLPGGGTANVTINSLLIPVEHLKPEAIDAIRNACVNLALTEAVRIFGAPQPLTVRDLNALDMSYTSNIFTETSNTATANAWNAMTFGAFTVATGTVLGFYGVGMSVVHDATIDFYPITAVRWDVGGARKAQWHIQSLASNTSAASVAQTLVVWGVTKSPIIVGEDITVTLYEYTRTLNTIYEPCWLGCCVEKEGRTLMP